AQVDHDVGEVLVLDVQHDLFVRPTAAPEIGRRHRFGTPEREHEGDKGEPSPARGRGFRTGWWSVSCRHVRASRAAWPGPHGLHTRNRPDRAPDAPVTMLLARASR